MKKTRKRDSTRSKTDILKAAEQEFAEKGFYGARIDSIANNAGINKRMIYEYFGNKQELYKQVLTSVYSRLTDREMGLLAKDINGVDAIRKIIRLYFEFLRDNPSYVNLILWENLSRGKYVQQTDITGIKASAFEKIRQIINDGKKAGVFRQNVDTEQVILSILTYTFSYFSNRYTLSKLLGRDLADEENMRKREANITEMILEFIT